MKPYVSIDLEPSPKYFLWVLVNLAASICGFADNVSRPDQALRDDRGLAIQAHGGGLLVKDGVYFWYGEDYAADVPPGQRAVSLYSSTDLVNWKFRHRVLCIADPENFGPEWVLQRPKIYHNRTTGKYVMYMHVDAPGPNGRYKLARVAVAVSERIDGDYRYVRSFRPLGHESRDIGQFVDDDGRAYLIFEDRQNGFRIARLSDDYLDVAEEICLVGEHLEAFAMVKHEGLYYLMGSGLTGWAPNPNKYAVAKSLGGPWSEFRDIAPPETKTYGSQSAALLLIEGTQHATIIFTGDRWNAESLGTSTYLWMPLELDAGQVKLPAPRPWSIDLQTGASSYGF